MLHRFDFPYVEPNNTGASFYQLLIILFDTFFHYIEFKMLIPVAKFRLDAVFLTKNRTVFDIVRLRPPFALTCRNFTDWLVECLFVFLPFRFRLGVGVAAFQLFYLLIMSLHSAFS